MNETKPLACPFCGGENIGTITPSGGSGREILLCCSNADCTVQVWGKDRADAIAKWNRRAGGRKPAMPETVDVKALASATCSAARVEKERSLLLWMREVVAILAYQIDIPHQHKVDISEALDRYQKSLDAVEQQNKQAEP